MSAKEPMFNVPRAVVWASGLMIAIQAVRVLLPETVDLNLLLTLAFIPARYSGAASQLPGGYPACVTSFVTYMVVHAGWLHLTVNLLWMLAFGSAIARRIGDSRFLYFSVCCGVAGALTHLAFHFGEMAPVVGASAAISGQMAAALRIMFGMPPQATATTERIEFVKVELPRLRQTLSDGRMLFFLVLWVVVNLAFGLGAFRIAGTEGGIAWEAHIGGFLFGLLGFGLFDRHPDPSGQVAAE